MKVLLPLTALFVCSPLAAQEGGDQPASSTAALQKATQNPVADLISVPLQNNMNFGVGPYNGTQNVLNSDQEKASPAEVRALSNPNVRGYRVNCLPGACVT